MPSQPVMDDDQIWLDRLQRWQLRSVAPLLLDVLRPLGLVGSQLIIMAKPVLTSFVSSAQARSADGVDRRPRSSGASPPGHRR